MTDLGTTPSQFLVREREQLILLHALRQLRLDYQIALELHYWEGLAGAEVGEVLGVPEATTRTWLRRAKLELAERVDALAREGVPPSTESDLAHWAASLKAQLQPDSD